MSVCLCVCLYSKEIQTAGRIWMKFGTDVVLGGGKVLGLVLRFKNIAQNANVNAALPGTAFSTPKHKISFSCLAILSTLWVFRNVGK